MNMFGLRKMLHIVHLLASYMYWFGLPKKWEKKFLNKKNRNSFWQYSLTWHMDTLSWTMTWKWQWPWSFFLKAINANTCHFVKEFSKVIKIQFYHFSWQLVHIKGDHAKGLHFLYFLHFIYFFKTMSKSSARLFIERTGIFQNPLWIFHNILLGYLRCHLTMPDI